MGSPHNRQKINRGRSSIVVNAYYVQLSIVSLTIHNSFIIFKVTGELVGIHLRRSREGVG